MVLSFGDGHLPIRHTNVANLSASQEMLAPWTSVRWNGLDRNFYAHGEERNHALQIQLLVSSDVVFLGKGSVNRLASTPSC